VFDWFRNSAKARAFVRTMAVAIIAYLLTARAKGDEFGDAGTFLYGLYGAIIYGIAAVLTPIEPLVGVKADVSEK
jgi:hypothetical protein